MSARPGIMGVDAGEVLARIQAHSRPGAQPSMVDTLVALEICDEIGQRALAEIGALIDGALALLPRVDGDEACVAGGVGSSIALLHMAREGLDKVAGDIRSQVDRAGAWTTEAREESRH